MKRPEKLAWPQFSRHTDRLVLDILHSGRVNYWTGDVGRRFERTFADWLGVPEAMSVGSGTTALHLALAALGVGAGDEVVVTPYSFRASATCAANAGAKMVFADVAGDHLLSAEGIARVLTPRTKAVVVVHLFGQVADLGPIVRLCRARKLFLVEDCAQCLGGEYRGRKVGTVGDAGCFSFCQSKHITTGGEGGMVVCRSRRVRAAVRSLRDHGWVVGTSPKTYDRIGFNARLTELQSAVGLGELARLETWNLPRRRRLAEELVKGLAGHPLVEGLPVDTPARRASFWLVPFVIRTERLKGSFGAFVDRLQREGAGAYKVLWPLMAAKPTATRLFGRTVGFWVHPTRTLAEIHRDVAIFRKVAEAFDAG